MPTQIIEPGMKDMIIEKRTYDASSSLMTVDIFYAAPQAHRIVNVALHWKYPLGIVFI
jgi:hypothetical protein